MSTDGRDAADGLADTRDHGPQAHVNPPSDPLAETEAGPLDLPSSGDPLRDLADRAAVRAKLFGTSRADEAPTIGRYAILKVLGEGGMGTVYACFDDKLDRRLALKLLKGPESEAARKRMLREAQAMAKLSHPNVVPVFEVGEHEGQLFVAMEYVKGMTLARWQSEEEHSPSPTSWPVLLAVVSTVTTSFTTTARCLSTSAMMVPSKSSISASLSS